MASLGIEPDEVQRLTDLLITIARRIEAEVRTIYDNQQWSLVLVGGRCVPTGGTLANSLETSICIPPESVFLPSHAPDGLLAPLDSLSYPPERYLRIVNRVTGIGPPGAPPEETGVGFFVHYGSRTWRFATQEERRAFLARRGYLWSPSANPATDPPDSEDAAGVIIVGNQMPGGEGEPLWPGAPFVAGNIIHAGLTTLANGIASQQFRIANPVVATLVDTAVGRAVDEVGTRALTSLNINVTALPRDFTTRLQNGMVAGLTSLVSSMVMNGLLDSIGIDGLPADVLTGIVSNTASTYVTAQMGLSLSGAGAISLSEAFRGSLAAVPAGIIGSHILNLLEIRNPTARMAGNVASAIVLAANAGGPIVAAAAMVATTIIFNVLGIGSNAGPIGITDITVQGGRFTVRPPRTNRNGFSGPAEQLTMTVQMIAHSAAPVLNGALEVVGAHVQGMRGRTSLRFHMVDNQIRAYVNDEDKRYGLGAHGGIAREFIERILQGADLVIPPEADPLLVMTLRRGWYDWVVNAADPDFRASLPESETVYTLFDMVGRVLDLAGNPSYRPLRPPTGTAAEIALGMLGVVRLAANAVDVAFTSFINSRNSGGSSTPIGSLGCFEPWAAAVDVLRTLGEETGFVFLPVPEPRDIEGLPPQDNVTSDVFDRLSQARLWLRDTATPPAQTGEPMVLPPGSLTVTAQPSPLVRVSWQAVGPGERVLVRWQSVDGPWQSQEVGDGARSLELPGVVVGASYVIQTKRLAAPVAGTRRESAWTPPRAVTVPSGLDGAEIGRLELSQQGPDTAWDGRDVQIAWSARFPSLPGGGGILSTTGPSIPAGFRGYQVRIFTGDGRLLREMIASKADSHTYRYEDNLADSRALGLRSASRELRFEVSILPGAGQPLGTRTLTVTNAAPPKVGVVATAGLGILSVEVTPVEDLDLDGYAVWISDQPGFDPATLAPVYRGPSPQVVQRNLVLGDWYIRAAAVDLFQPRDGLDVAGLNLSDEVMVTLADITIDKRPPAVPTGLTLASAVGFTRSGEQIATLKASWDRNEEADFLVYEGQIRRDEDGDWTDFSLGLPAEGQPVQIWQVTPGTAFSVRVRGRDRSGNASDYCEAVGIVSAVDTAPPGPVTGVVAEVGLRSVILRWTNPPDLDLDMVEVHRAAANDRDQAILLGAVRGSVFADQGLAADSTWHYWLRALDRTGNAGEWSHGGTDGLSVIIPRAVAADIADAQLDFAKFAQGIEPVGMVDALPAPAGYTGPRTVMLTGDGKLYRLVAGAWTAAVAAGDVAGELAAHQIAANAIIAGKIAAGAVNADKI
ncbi:MAG: hypothetical protein RLY86_3822, partial [Pseudomonadota bacterium]